MFVAKSKGGLGLRNPTNMYIARKISFMVEMINSDDNKVRFVARESLQLHMNKRKVNLFRGEGGGRGRGGAESARADFNHRELP